jgi:hypothetical protein
VLCRWWEAFPDDRPAPPDARLIAAAPDLLLCAKSFDAFLSRMLEETENEACESLREYIRAVIEKATA